MGNSTAGQLRPGTAITSAELFLYVPKDEVAEALALGARYVEGDARLVLPPSAIACRTFAPFDRWRTTAARYCWCLAYVARILGDVIASSPADEALDQSVAGRAASQRVYLFVPSHAIARVREVPGVLWDRRRRMYYAGTGADLRKLFEWLTPAAQIAWESEGACRKAVSLMVKDRAVKEAAASANSGGAGTETRERVEAMFSKRRLARNASD